MLSVAFSADNRQIVSGSRDKTIKLWNTLAECKFTIVEDGHSDWVSCVRFSPNHTNPIIVSAGWDHAVKVIYLFILILVSFFQSVLYEGFCILGLEPYQLQIEDQPQWTYWIFEHSYRIS